MNSQIRTWHIEDAANLANALNNPKILDRLRDGLPYPYTAEDAKQYIELMLNADREKAFAFAITVEDQAIGSIGVFRKDNIHFRTAELGYYISEEYWGKGIGTQAVKQVCRYIYENTDIVRIFAEPFASNIASCRILEKAGFACEGILRKNAVKNGKIIDMKLYAMISDKLVKSCDENQTD
jgi:RimJ/RimL family protein N-acetyltransferase